MTEGEKFGRSESDRRSRRDLSEEEFKSAIKGSRLSDTSIDVARSVLVDGMQQVDVAKLHGLTEGRVSTIVKTVLERATKSVAEAHRQVEMVQADYDIAVAGIRKSLGDSVMMVQPENGVNYKGRVISRTEFHVAQDIGRRTAVIHRLSALDVAPSIGDVVHVRYENGRGCAVVARDRRMSERGR